MKGQEAWNASPSQARFELSCSETEFIVVLQSPVSSIHARVKHHIGDVSFFPFGEHFLTFGVTFFLWRDLLLMARLFFLAQIKVNLR